MNSFSFERDTAKSCVQISKAFITPHYYVLLLFTRVFLFKHFINKSRRPKKNTKMCVTRRVIAQTSLRPQLKKGSFSWRLSVHTPVSAKSASRCCSARWPSPRRKYQSFVWPQCRTRSGALSGDAKWRRKRRFQTLTSTVLIIAPSASRSGAERRLEMHWERSKGTAQQELH